MKKILISLGIGLIIGALAVFLIFHETTPQKIESVEKNSFYEVTAHLNMGGNFYFYADTEKVIQKIEKFALTLRKILETQIKVGPASTVDPLKVFDFVFQLVKKTGLTEISGLGMSSIKVGEDLNHTTFMLHHYPEKGKGLIWNLMQEKPHRQTELEMLPADTVLANFTDFNLKSLWAWIKNEAEASEIPDIKKGVLSLEPLLKSQGVDLDKLLGSLSGRMGMALVMDSKKSTSLPMGKVKFEIPNPDFVLIFSTNDSYIFDLLQKMLPFAQKQPEGNEKKINIPVGNLPIPIKPVIWQRDNLLFLATNESIVDTMFDTRKQENGLIESDEFSKMSVYMPEKGNSFRFMSSRLFQLIVKFQQQAMQASGQIKKEEDVLARELLNWLPKEISVYAVSQNSSDGLIFTINHNINMEFLALLPAAAMAGTISAVAIPNMLIASQKAKQNATMSDMKTIATAIEMYITEKRVAPQGNSLAEIRVQLEPDFITNLPLKDAWGNDFVFTPGKMKNEYFIASAGRDGIFNGFDQNGIYAVVNIKDFDNDIIFKNGDFIFHPDFK